MLNKVLEFISKSGDFSTKSIANKLNIPETVAEDLKNRLEMMGYIQRIEDECSSESCKKCSCGCGKLIKLDRTVKWQITNKGENLMNKMEA